jgi:hypothetical protein
LCEALIAAAFAFFSVIRLAIRALHEGVSIFSSEAKGTTTKLVFGFLLLLVFYLSALEGAEVTAALEANGCDEALNFRTK